MLVVGWEGSSGGYFHPAVETRVGFENVRFKWRGDEKYTSPSGSSHRLP